MQREDGRIRVHSALASEARARILRLLRASPKPLSAQELASASGQPLTTMRFHLESLATAGLVAGSGALPDGRGRPRLLYVAAMGGASGSGKDEGYRWLSEVLTEAWAEAPALAPAVRAEAAGLRWAKANTRTAPSRSAQDVVDAVTAVFTEFGFEPETVGTGMQTELRLNACPFIEVARRHQDVVCNVHLGLMKGLIGGSAGDRSAATLQPFAGDGYCTASIKLSSGNTDQTGTDGL